MISPGFDQVLYPALSGDDLSSTYGCNCGFRRFE